MLGNLPLYNISWMDFMQANILNLYRCMVILIAWSSPCEYVVISWHYYRLIGTCNLLKTKCSTVLRRSSDLFAMTGMSFPHPTQGAPSPKWLEVCQSGGVLWSPQQVKHCLTAKCFMVHLELKIMPLVIQNQLESTRV